MALLEALPETVENSLRDLREQRLALSDTSAGTGSNGKNGAAPVASASAAAEMTEPEAAAETTPESDKPIAFETDITESGAFGTEWVVIDSGQVYVFAPNGGTRAHLRHSVPLERIKEAKAEIHIGNGEITVRTDSETIPLVRFSQATVAEAHAVTRQISALAKGEEARQENIEAKKKRCPRCKRVLPEDTEVCPACVNKRAVMLRLFQFLAPFKWQAVANVVVILAVNSLELAPPYIGKLIIDTLTQRPGKTGWTPAEQSAGVRYILLLVGMLALVRVVVGGFQYAQRRLSSWLGARILMDIRISL